MSRVEPQYTNYINLTANSWTAMNTGATATFALCPKGKAGSLFVANGSNAAIIALSFDAGTTYHLFIPPNAVVDLGQTDPYTMHARCAVSNQVSWWFVTE